MKKISLAILITISTLFYLLNNVLSVNAQSTQTDPTPSTLNQTAQEKDPQTTQVTQIDPQQLPLNTEPNVPQNLSTYTQSVFIEILGAGSCFMAGFNPLSVDGRCLGINPVTKKLGYADPDGGLIAVAGDMIGTTYNIPLSSTQYGAYMAGHFGISQSAYAQGVGFAGLSPIIKVWEVFRDITYFLFLIVFIVLGLGIMFRLNLDARSVMTIQNQIPKIVIALILITLSYAIVGFLVDMMYVLMYLVINIFADRGLAVIPSIDTNPINAVGGLGGLNAITEPVATTAGNALGGIFDGNLGGGLGNFLTKVIGGIMGGTAGAGIGKLVGGVAGLALGGVAAALAIPSGGMSLAALPLILGIVGTGLTAGTTVGSLIGGTTGAAIGAATAGTLIKYIAFLIAYLVILLAVLSALFRTWIMLIKAFIMVLIGTIFAPFWILAGILPGGGGGIGSWLRTIIANLAAFPTVLILFLIGKSIQEQASSSPNDILIPPFIGSLGDNPASGFASIIGLGVVLIMPESLSIVKGMLKAPDTGALMGGMGKSLGVGSGVVGGAFGGIRKSLWYTNPHTGESGRLKAWTGTKTSKGLDKVPGIGKGIDKIKYQFGGDKTKGEIDAKRKAEEERREIASRPKPGEPNFIGPVMNPGSRPTGGSGGGFLAGIKTGIKKSLNPALTRKHSSNPGSGGTTPPPAPPPPPTSGPPPAATSAPDPTPEEIDNEVQRIKTEEGRNSTLLTSAEVVELRERARENLRNRGTDPTA